MKVTVGKNIELECQICRHNDFDERKAQLNTAVMSLWGLDWLNRSARCFVCLRCGYIHWFLPHDSE